MNKIYLDKKSSASSLGLIEILDSEKILYGFKEPENRKDNLLINPTKVGKASIIISEPKMIIKNKEKLGLKGKIEIVSLENKKLELKLEESEITRGMKLVLEKAGLSNIVPIPCGSAIKIADSKGWKVIATCNANSEDIPAIIKKGNIIIFLFDVGKCFYELITEKYFERKKDKIPISNHIIEYFYKKIPYFIRKFAYESYYKNLHSKMREMRGFKTLFPIDPAGYVLRQLVVSSIKSMAETVSIDRFPKGYTCSYVITHDVEPTEFSYKKGLPALAAELKRLGIKPTINLVAKYDQKYVKNKEILGDFELASHDLIHDRTFSLISREERKNRLIESKKMIESKYAKEVLGFRSPALQITADLPELLEEAGYKYDMSFIDVQRETIDCGAGNSYFLPYYMFKKNGKRSKILEIPTVAPDCISPIYFGFSFEETKELFSRKISWIKSIGGFGNFIVHAGTWGKEDSRRRIELLNHILKNISHDSWVCNAREIFEWWNARNKLALKSEKNALYIANNYDSEIKDITITIEKPGKKQNNYRYVHIESIKPKQKIQVI